MSPAEIIRRYWKIEETRDVEAVLGCYAENAELLVPGLGLLSGHSQIRSFYQQSVERFPGLAVEIVGSVEHGDRGAFEWRSVFTDHNRRRIRLKGANVVRVSDGKLAEVHVYYDPTELDAESEQD